MELKVKIFQNPNANKLKNFSVTVQEIRGLLH